MKRLLELLMFEKTKRLVPGEITLAGNVHQVQIIDTSYGNIFTRKLGVNVNELDMKITNSGVLVINIKKKEEDEKI